MGNRVPEQRPKPSFKLMYYDNFSDKNRTYFSDKYTFVVPKYKTCAKCFYVGEWPYYSMQNIGTQLPIDIMEVVWGNIILVNRPTLTICSCGRKRFPVLIKLNNEYQVQHHKPITWSINPTAHIYPKDLVQVFVYILNVPNFGQIFISKSANFISFNHNIIVAMPKFNTWNQTLKLDNDEIVGCFTVGYCGRLILIKTTGEMLDCMQMPIYLEHLPWKYGTEDENITVSANYESAAYFRKQQTGRVTKPSLRV